MSSISVISIPKTFTNLSVPSVIFADDEGGVSWYGSLRGGVQFGGDLDGRHSDAYSRMGIKGSNEVSEGLAAVYQFEHSINTSTADQTGGRLSYVGLSGGFGTLTLGQVWGAAYNNSGGMRDINNFYGGSDVTGGGRVGNAVSYAFSSGAASMQVDAIMDNAKDTGSSVDQLGFGMTINLGDIGKLGIAYENLEDATTTMAVTGATPSMLTGENMLTASLDKDNMLDKSKNKLAFRTKDGRMVVSDAVVTHMITDGATGKSHKADLMVVYVGPSTGTPAMLDSADRMKVIKHTDGKYYGGACVSAEGAFDSTACGGTNKPVASIQYVTTTSTEGTSGVTKTYMAYTPDATDKSKLKDTMSYVMRYNAYGVMVDNRDRRIDSMGRYLRVEGGGGAANIYVTEAGHGVLIPETGTVAVDDPSTAWDDRKYKEVPDLTVGDVSGETTALGSNQATTLSGDKKTAYDMYFGTTAKAEDKAKLVSKNRTAVASIKHTAAGNVMDTDYGHTSKHVSAQFNLGVVTLGLGYTETEQNDPMMPMKEKTTYLGAGGSIGDSGMSWVAQARNKEAYNAAGKYVESSPWTVGVAKSLGDGARVFVEHQNSDDGKGGSSVIGLRADF